MEFGVCPVWEDEEQIFSPTLPTLPHPPHLPHLPHPPTPHSPVPNSLHKHSLVP
ncbi:MAG: hypothetical protein RMY29_005575 [Nostoc sp. CreGUA01]|nr:hypothetical protein [Nostoc sp. CreGUA01]